MLRFGRRTFRHRVRQAPGSGTPSSGSSNVKTTETNTRPSSSPSSSPSAERTPLAQSPSSSPSSTSPSTSTSSPSTTSTTTPPSSTQPSSTPKTTSHPTTSSTSQPAEESSTITPMTTTTVVIIVSPPASTTAEVAISGSGSSSKTTKIVAISSSIGFMFLLSFVGLLYWCYRRKRQSRYARRGSRASLDSERSILPKSFTSEHVETPLSDISVMYPHQTTTSPKSGMYGNEKRPLRTPSPARIRPALNVGAMTNNFEPVDPIIEISPYGSAVEQKSADAENMMVIDISNNPVQPAAPPKSFNSKISRVLSRQSFASSFWSAWSRIAEPGDPIPDDASTIGRSSRISRGFSIRSKRTVAEPYQQPPDYPLDLARKIAEQYPRPTWRGQSPNRKPSKGF